MLHATHPLLDLLLLLVLLLHLGTVAGLALVPATSEANTHNSVISRIFSKGRLRGIYYNGLPTSSGPSPSWA
jgi:hypothetical protein